MALQDYDPCESRLLAHEGSTYTDGVHPYDPGGPTRWGITITDARLHWKLNATPNDVRTMPIKVAKGIYRAKYWSVIRGDNLPAGVDDTVFDYGVNSGNGRAGKVLRRLCSLPDNTSKIDDTVLTAVAKRDAKTLIHAINNERLKFLQSLAIWPTYKNGWTTRVHEVESFSLSLAAAPGAVPTTPITPSTDVGKGQITPPTTAKNVAKGGGVVAAGSGSVFMDWIAVHTVETAMIAVAIVAITVLVINLINKNHQTKQEAPTPGLVPVPETKP